jgi:hypothetical protein
MFLSKLIWEHLPMGDEPRVMTPHTYLILASSIWPTCPKVPFRNRLPQQQQKESDHSFNTQIPSIYAYGQNTPSMLESFAILVVWWGGKQ